MKKIKNSNENQTIPNSDQMLQDYWEFEKSADGQQVFSMSDQDFLSKYSNQYCYQALLSVTFYATFDVDECDVCLRPFKVIINSREHFHSYRSKEKKICRICENYRASIKDLDGKIA
jgi:hypothetical protein